MVLKTEVVCPNDTNPMGFLQGGRLVQWMDIAAAICAETHAEKICVTASMDKVQFYAPARVGDIIRIEAILTCAFHTSMEIYVHASKQTIGHTERQRIGEALLTFVALDDQGKPVQVALLEPTNNEERQRYEDARKRKSRA